MVKGQIRCADSEMRSLDGPLFFLRHCLAREELCYRILGLACRATVRRPLVRLARLDARCGWRLGVHILGGCALGIPVRRRSWRIGRERARAGTVPTSSPASPSLVLFPGRLSSRLHIDSQNTKNMSSGHESFLSVPLDKPEEEEEEEDVELQMMEQPEPEGRHEAVEGRDSVGLLGVMPCIPILPGSDGSRPDISKAAQSFVTAPATLAGTSDSSEQPQSWGEHMVDRPHADLPGFASPSRRTTIFLYEESLA